MQGPLFDVGPAANLALFNSASGLFVAAVRGVCNLNSVLLMLRAGSEFSMSE